MKKTRDEEDAEIMQRPEVRTAAAVLGGFNAVGAFREALPIVLTEMVDRLEYDFHARCGKLYMPEGNCTDMEGVIALFKGLDPAVLRVETFSGERPDMVYIKITQEWEVIT